MLSSRYECVRCHAEFHWPDADREASVGVFGPGYYPILCPRCLAQRQGEHLAAIDAVFGARQGTRQGRVPRLPLPPYSELLIKVGVAVVVFAVCILARACVADGYQPKHNRWDDEGPVFGVGVGAVVTARRRRGRPAKEGHDKPMRLIEVADVLRTVLFWATVVVLAGLGVCCSPASAAGELGANSGGGQPPVQMRLLPDEQSPAGPSFGTVDPPPPPPPCPPTVLDTDDGGPQAGQADRLGTRWQHFGAPVSVGLALLLFVRTLRRRWAGFRWLDWLIAMASLVALFIGVAGCRRPSATGSAACIKEAPTADERRACADWARQACDAGMQEACPWRIER